MANVFYDSDANLDLIKNETIAIIGYGSQGHAHALNLRDSGCDVIVGLYEGSKSWPQAEKDGLKVATAAEAARQAQTVMIAIHDHLHKPVFEESIRPHMTAGKTLMVAHGFSVHYTQLVPSADIDVTLVAPKSPGHILRREYTKGMGVPGLVAIHQDVTGRAKDRALAYAKGIGCTRSGVIETTFGEETETDLFGEQAVLCGGITALIKAGFETLVEAGYQPELAYFECLNEMKLIVDLIWEGGLGLMRYSVSDTAEYGDYTAGPKIFDEHVRETLRKLLKDIQDGTFAKEWILENQAGRPQFNTARRREKEHQIEKVGAELRAMMTWAKTIY